MTLYEFRLLDEMEQAEVLWDAVHLMDRFDGPYKYELYQRDGFYIELKRHIEHGVCQGLRPFKSTTPLDAYFEEGDMVNPSAIDGLTKKNEDILGNVLNKMEQRKKAMRRGHFLVWYILVPLTILFIAYRIYIMCNTG